MKKLLAVVLFLATVNVYATDIGYVETYPFAYAVDGKLTGDEVRIVESQFDVINYVRYNTSASLVDAVSRNEVECGIGGLSITPERLETCGFSTPYCKNEVIVVCRKSQMTTSYKKIALSVLNIIWGALKWLIVMLTVFAHSIWFIERHNKDEQHFASTYVNGIGQAYWWSLVTCTTVGYGDVVPKSLSGRLLASVIMIAGIIWFGCFTAFLMGKVGELKNYSDMYIATDFRIAGTLAGTTSSDLLSTLGVIKVDYQTLDDAVDALNLGKVDCVVYDTPPLGKYLGDGSKLKETGEVLKTEYLGIAISPESDAKKRIDMKIIKNMEKGG